MWAPRATFTTHASGARSSSRRRSRMPVVSGVRARASTTSVRPVEGVVELVLPDHPGRRPSIGCGERRTTVTSQRERAEQAQQALGDPAAAEDRHPCAEQVDARCRATTRAAAGVAPEVPEARRAPGRARARPPAPRTRPCRTSTCARRGPARRRRRARCRPTGSCTQSICGWASSSVAQARRGRRGRVHTRPSASPGSTIVAPPASTASPSQLPRALGRQGDGGSVGHGGILRAGLGSLRSAARFSKQSGLLCCLCRRRPHPRAPLLLFGRAPMPEITLDLTLFATAFVTVLVIMDPVGNIPIFLALTKGQDVPQRRRSALLASTRRRGRDPGLRPRRPAGARAARHLARGAPGGRRAPAARDRARAAPPVRRRRRRRWPPATRTSRSCRSGTPLLAGPGAIAATMLYSRQADDLGGTLSVVLAIAAVLTVIYLSMRYAVAVRQGAPRQRHRAPVPGDGPPRRRHRRPARRPSRRGLGHQRRGVASSAAVSRSRSRASRRRSGSGRARAGARRRTGGSTGRCPSDRG